MDHSQEILSKITHYSKYSKFLPLENRRETWNETVERNKQMHLDKFPALHDDIERAYALVYAKKVLPSMRSLQFSGKAILKNNARMYNCSATTMVSTGIKMFSEVLYLLLSGVGVGYSTLKEHVATLPKLVQPQLSDKVFYVEDSIEGWSDLIGAIVSPFFGVGYLPVEFDYSLIRTKGTPLETSGGKAPGPDKIREVASAILTIMHDAVANNTDGKIKPIQVHDIICHEADAVLSGGIRRSACICLYSLDDEEMLKCKSTFAMKWWAIDKIDDNYYFSGETELKFYNKKLLPYKANELDFITEELSNTHSLAWYWIEPQRARANNSVTLKRGDVSEEQFYSILKKTQASNAGEPGIFWTNDYLTLTNPCSEISLRDCQFCNLTTFDASTITTKEDYEERVWAATFIGTLQAAYTDFNYISDIWRKNCEEEALLGVSKTGIASGTFKFSYLESTMARYSVELNKKYAKTIGINPAARVTTIKPEGTASLLLGTSSGVHDYYSEYYIRRIRLNKEEPLYKYVSKALPDLVEDEIFLPDSTAVLSVGIKSPEGSLLRKHTSALAMLERIKFYNEEWIQPGHVSGHNTHNVSCTVNVKEEEWEDVIHWMWKNKDYYTGISLLPYDNGSYRQAPFEECTKETYDEYYSLCKDIDLSAVYETEDLIDHTTTNIACSGGVCEIL